MHYNIYLMIVANAIYDVVFKYLLEDRSIAKLLLSGLLQTQVLEVELKPQEYSADLKENLLTVYRIDFKAKIKLKNGEEKLVLIEVQKAKFSTDIMRFRKYLGKQYANEDNTVEENGRKKALPIISIYFIGYPLEGIENIPVIRIARHYLDHATGKPLTVKSDFVESLTHDSIIVQIEAIKRKRRKNEIEKVLSVFEQGQKHEISIDENDYPEKYKPIIRRLLKAVQDKQVRDTMEVEDEILEELQLKEREAEKALLLAAKAERELIKSQQEKEQERKEKEMALKREKEAIRREQEAKHQEKVAKDREQEAKQREKQMAIKLAKQLLKLNLPLHEIDRETGLSIEEIEALQ